MFVQCKLWVQSRSLSHPGPLLRPRSPPPPQTHLSTTMNALSRREEDTVVKTAKGRALKLCDPVVKGA